MAKKIEDLKYPYQEITVRLRFRNVKPVLKKQIGAIAKKLGYENTNDFLLVQLTEIRDKYGKQFPEILNLKD